MKARMSFLVPVLGLLLSAPVFAHHSFRAEFDSTKPMEFVGTVTKVEWFNRHARFCRTVFNGPSTDGKPAQ